MSARKIAALAAILAALSSCGGRPPLLEGERLDPRSVSGADAQVPLDATAAPAGSPVAAERTTDTAGARSVPVGLPAATLNADWTHRGGNDRHWTPNAALGTSLTRIWAVDAGAGNSRRARIATEPVVGGGVVYALDAAATLSATTISGGTAWRTSLVPPGERGAEASGGGLALGSGRVFATTGYGELVAVDVASGAIAWRQRFDAAVGGAPTVSEGTVYVVARDGSAWAVRASDGKVVWQVDGIPSRAGVIGASAPAIAGARVIFPFGNGQLLAVERATGVPVWQSFVAGKRLGRAIASVSDITGDPVIVNGVIYAGTSSGRVAAFDAETGTTLWAADEGAGGPVAVAGGALWLVNDENQLVRLNAGTGEVVWRIDLPFFTKDKVRKRNAIFAQFGPLMAGNLLRVASTDGYLRSFDPASGRVIAATEVPGGAASAPVVAGGTLFLMSANGQLQAFR